MKEITTKDLREYLTLLLPQKHPDGEGGWHETWKKGPYLWASIWPLIGGDGFYKAEKKRPMSLPLARYQIIIRAGINFPLKAAFLWHLRSASKRLCLISTPVLIQYNRFLKMIAVEETDA